MRTKPGGSRQGKIVLVQYRGPADPETGGSFTVKRYSSEKSASGDGSWHHERILLEPLNPAFRPIELTAENEGDVAVLAEYVTTLR
jgi:SOS-response transcriptional repressor LexA